MHVVLASLLSILTLHASCQQGPKSNSAENHPPQNSNHQARSFDTTIIYLGHPCDIHFASSNAPTLLLLPGWNFDKKRWCDSSKACTWAAEKGWNWVAPDMRKSVYASKYFTETWNHLKKEPTLLWLADSLIPLLKKDFHLFENANFVLGLSTGGRGVALLCEHNDTLFTAAAALSGDFDQSAMPTDKLMAAFYGPFSSFSQRWKTIDNPTYHAPNLKTPLFLGHGSLDPIVPVSQTSNFGQVLIAKNKTCKVLISQGFRHDFTYWNHALDEVFPFFEQYLKK